MTDYEFIYISDGIELEGAEEEYGDKMRFYNLSQKIKVQNGLLERTGYDIYVSILEKYDMK